MTFNIRWYWENGSREIYAIIENGLSREPIGKCHSSRYFHESTVRGRRQRQCCLHVCSVRCHCLFCRWRVNLPQIRVNTARGVVMVSIRWRHKSAATQFPQCDGEPCRMRGGQLVLMLSTRCIIFVWRYQNSVLGDNELLLCKFDNRTAWRSHMLNSTCI